MSWEELFNWLRLVLTVLGSVPALAFLVMTRPSQKLQPPIPMWVTWWQSLAIAVLLGNGALLSIKGLWDRQPIPILVAWAAVIGAYLLLGYLRSTLMVWRLKRRFGRHAGVVQPTPSTRQTGLPP
jgi:hypothetical protein